MISHTTCIPSQTALDLHNHSQKRILKEVKEVVIPPPPPPSHSPPPSYHHQIPHLHHPRNRHTPRHHSGQFQQCFELSGSRRSTLLIRLLCGVHGEASIPCGMRCGCCELDDAELLVEHEGIPTSSHSRCARNGGSVVGAWNQMCVGGFVLWMECNRSKDLDVPWTSPWVVV
jgi:hypothetical protein